MGARHSPWQIGIGEAQAQKFIKRKFDANAYIDITAQMDTHGVSRGRGPLKEVHPCGCVDVWMCVCVCANVRSRVFMCNGNLTVSVLTLDRTRQLPCLRLKPSNECILRAKANTFLSSHGALLYVRAGFGSHHNSNLGCRRVKQRPLSRIGAD